ncbi:MAG: DeoD-type purine-nucleoside phosphorylase [Rhizobiaceae bacterium]
MTPHNEAGKGDYAEIVLLPGDPDRAAWIAGTYLDGVRTVNRIRGALGFTGTFQGRPVSVQATGMGQPSLAIYVHELINVYGVKTMIRTGSCGGLSERLSLRDLVVSTSVASDSGMYRDQILPFVPAGAPDFGLARLAAAIQAPEGVGVHFGPTASSDDFYYHDAPGRYARLRNAGVIAIDMETAGLYALAAHFGVRALSVCTVVDDMLTGEETAHSERQALFGPLASFALSIAAAA